MKLQIPEKAMPVVYVLRRDVRKPPKSKMVEDCIDGKGKGWLRKLHSSNGGVCIHCPMGLHPYSWNPTPYNWRQFGRQASFDSVRAFAEWWDGLPIEQARKAVDLIWP